jgi:outer membrane usher protein
MDVAAEPKGDEATDFQTVRYMEPWGAGGQLRSGVCIALLCINLLVFVAAFAFPADAWSHAGERAILQLIVNEVDKGEVLSLRRPDDILIRLTDLEAAAVQTADGKREFIGEEAYVSLSSLGPATTYVFDERNLTIRLKGKAGLQELKKLDFSPTAPNGMVYSEDTSLFLNYAAETKGLSEYSLFGEAGLSIAGHLFSSTISRTEDGHVVRGLSNLTLNDRERLTRWIIGDNFVSNGGLGGNTFLGGIGVARNFTLNPYYYFFPRPGVTGTALVPSTVSVYSDGGLLRQERLAPGQFELNNLPVSSGYRTNRVVIRDIFGRETEIVSPFYLSTKVLQAGLSEYSFNAGLRRNDLTESSWDYDSPVMLGRYRMGLSENMTPGASIELGTRLANGGLRLTAKSLIGEVDLSVAGSHDSGATGTAASLTYVYLQRWFSIGASARTMSDQYATVSMPLSADRPKREVTGFIGVPIGTRVNVNLQATQTTFRDTGVVERIGVSGSFRLSDSWSLFSSNSWSQQTGERATYDFFVGLSYFFGNNTTGYAFTQRQQGRTFDREIEGVRVQKSLPVGPGFGYQVEGTVGDDSHGLGQLQYQGQYGRYEARYDSLVKDPVFTMSGGLVAIGGSVHATRRVDDSFVLIRTPGVAGLRGYINNQEVGTTDSRGELIVPNNVLSYYGNRISINDRDIPIDYRVDATEKTIAPPFRGGALVVFPVARLQILTGTLSIETIGQTRIPAYGQLTVKLKDSAYDSPIGKKGEFYLENVPPGSYDATIDDEGRICRFLFEIPDSPEPILKLGAITCLSDAGETP